MSASVNRNEYPSFISSKDLALRLRVPHLFLMGEIRDWIHKNLPASMRDLILFRDGHCLVEGSLIQTVSCSVYGDIH